MQYEIYGGNLPVLSITLKDGEKVYTESGGMSWMSDNIEMETSTKGGLLKGIGRMFAGESLFLVNYTSRGKGKITFASEFPGEIKAIKLKANESIIIQKDSFLCAEDSVKLEIHFRKKLGTGLFGGEGFILQKATGPGIVFLEIDGSVTEYNLDKSEMIKVDTGHIAMYEESVSYELTTVKGVKNVLFSGEGLFLATLKGPGKVMLQSMPVRNLANKLLRYMPRTSGGGGKLSGINLGNVFEHD